MVAIPTGAFFATALAAFHLAKRGLTTPLFVLAALWVAFTIGMFVGLDQANGWDGLTYLAVLIGINAPGGAGLLFGALFGNARKPVADGPINATDTSGAQ
jgi:hypothetical protein